MKHAIKKALPCIFIFICLLASRSLSAGIIDKEAYRIPPEIKYKKALTFAVLPFSGKLSDERKYVTGLVANYISGKLLLYKKIMTGRPVIDFERSAFDSAGNVQGAGSSREGAGFLNLEQAGEDTVKKILSETAGDQGRKADLLDPAIAAGTDIIITGEIVQSGNNLSASLRVFNRFYGRVWDIAVEGTFRNIEKFLEDLSLEVNKAVITHYAYLSLYSDEKEAAVYIDDRFFGRTDRKDILLEAGMHKVEVSKENTGFNTVYVELAEGASESLRVDLKGSSVRGREMFSPEKVRLSITTVPDGARVYLDSDFLGLSPVVKYGIGSGIFRLRIDKEGYITKYSTIDTDRETGDSLDLNFTLEKGNSKDYYFKRTSVFNILFKSSLLGAGISSASYIYFGVRKQDESAKLRELSSSDPDYYDKKSSLEDKRDSFELYRQISLYSLGAMIISAGIFYYFDVAQDDIAIAVYYPAGNFNFNYTGQQTARLFSGFSNFSKDACFGISITKSF